MREVAGAAVCDGSPTHTLLTTGGTTSRLYMVERRHSRTDIAHSAIIVKPAIQVTFSRARVRVRLPAVPPVLQLPTAGA